MLVLAVVVETRLFVDDRGRLDRLANRALLGLVAVAEYRALRVLHAHETARLDSLLIWTALFGLAAYLIGFYVGYAAGRTPTSKK